MDTAVSKTRHFCCWLVQSWNCRRVGLGDAPQFVSTDALFEWKSVLQNFKHLEIWSWRLFRSVPTLERCKTNNTFCNQFGAELTQLCPHCKGICADDDFHISMWLLHFHQIVVMWVIIPLNLNFLRQIDRWTWYNAYWPSVMMSPVSPTHAVPDSAVSF